MALSSSPRGHDRAPAGPAPGPPRALRSLAELVALGALLFITHFVLQGELAPQVDQECHIGGIAVDLLAHGVRFPLMAYAPNEYDNGSFVQGVLAALSFTLFGRSVLALKLVTHAFVTAGAFAALVLVRRALGELGWTEARARWVAIVALLVSLAFMPRLGTMMSMFAVGNHTEGAAIVIVLVAIAATRAHARSAARTAALWALVGLAIYVNKGALLALPVLAGAEIALGRGERDRARRLAAALAGLIAGASPELYVIAQRHGRGWGVIAEKATRGSAGFPDAIVDSIVQGADGRATLLALAAAALGFGIVVALRSSSVAVRCVVALSLVHLAALSVMAQGGPDQYVLYGHPPLVVLTALGAAAIARRGGVMAGIGALVLLAAAHRPTALRWQGDTVAAMARDRSAAACSWRFAEGFGREVTHGLAPSGRTREEHELARCRTLSEPEQVASCIGGISREIHWRRQEHVGRTPPAGLTPIEAREYAYWYGTHRDGDATDCADFADPELQRTCTDAVQLDCLVFGDLYMRMATGRRSGRPHCEIAEPPVDGYWASMRRDLLSRPEGELVVVRQEEGDPTGCAPTFAVCYPGAAGVPAAPPEIER